MAVTTDAFTSADLAAFISETWTTIVNEELFAKAVFADFCTDLTPFMVAGSDIAHVPNVYTNTFTVQSQSTQGAEVTTAGPAQTDTTLTVDSHKYIAMIIGDLTLNQIASQYDVNAVYGRKIAGLLITDLEQAIATLWSSITTNSIGDTATVLSDSEVRQALQALAAGNYDLDESAFFVHPYVYWNQLHAIAKYTQAERLGVAPGPTVTGNLGNGAAKEVARRGHLYGVPVYVTTNVRSGLQTYRNLLLHKSAFGYAIQNRSMGRVRVQAENAIRNLGMLTVGDMVYGEGILREPGSVLLNASSAFLGS